MLSDTSVTSIKIAFPTNFDISKSSSPSPSSIMCLGASIWVPVWEYILNSFSANPSTSIVLVFLSDGGSVPG